MTFTLKQVLDLQWLVNEGYEIRVEDTGRVFYKDSDFKIKDRNEAELDVTELFLANAESASRLGDRLSDFMYERHCPECESYCDPEEIQVIDSDYVTHHQDQMCSDCCQDWTDSHTDPYTLRGLKRSDFY